MEYSRYSDVPKRQGLLISFEMTLIPFSERKSYRLLKWVGESLKSLFLWSNQEIAHSNCRNFFLETYNQDIS